MVFFFIGVFSVSAAPIEEKNVMVFVLDVDTGFLIEDISLEIPIESNTNINNQELYTDESLYRKIVYEATKNNGYTSNVNFLSVYYGSNKIRYDPIAA